MAEILEARTGLSNAQTLLQKGASMAEVDLKAMRDAVEAAPAENKRQTALFALFATAKEPQMLSRCTVCGTPTDMALIDVATKAQLERLGGNVPLLGTCGTETCV